MIRTQMSHGRGCRAGLVVRDGAAKGVAVFVCTSCGAKSTMEPGR